MTDKKRPSKNAVAINQFTDKQLNDLVTKLNKDSAIKHTKVSIVATLVHLKHKRECK